MNIIKRIVKIICYYKVISITFKVTCYTVIRVKKMKMRFEFQMVAVLYMEIHNEQNQVLEYIFVI